MYGSDFNYAKSRLERTVVRLRNEPVLIILIDTSNGVCQAQTLHEEPQDITCSVDELDLQPVPLGFCNTKYGATYVQRVPKRRDWKQGLRKENATVQVGYRFPAWHELRKAIVGEYPSFNKALSSKDKRGLPVAWSRCWAVSGADNNSIYYKDYSAAVGTVVNGKPTLFPEYSYLEEVLRHSLC